MPYNEEWRPVPIPGYDHYQVSDQGRLRNTRTGRPMRGTRNKSGHIAVTLSHADRSNPTVHRSYLHVLVATAFLGAPSPGQEARHYDGDPSNNTIENIRWGTRLENVGDAIRHGTHISALNLGKKTCPRGHALEGENLWKAALSRGARSCLACRRAYTSPWATRIRESGGRPTEDPYFVTLANDFYMRLLK